MRFSTKCWSEHILSAYKATKDLKHPLYMTFKDIYKVKLIICFSVDKCYKQEELFYFHNTVSVRNPRV